MSGSPRKKSLSDVMAEKKAALRSSPGKCGASKKVLLLNEELDYFPNLIENKVDAPDRDAEMRELMEEAILDPLAISRKYTVKYEEKYENVVPKTGFIEDPRMELHENPWDSNHVECPDRLRVSRERALHYGVIQRCQRIQSRPATDQEICSVHSESLLKEIKEVVEIESHSEKKDFLDSRYDSVYANKDSLLAARLAVGASIDLTKSIVQGKVRNGLGLIRPPGHHAMTDKSCGFCIFNNVAIAAQHALNHLNVKRILIVDLDVHHGQGTQQEFFNDPRVLYFSIHRYEYGLFWPHLRESNFDVIGDGEGKGYTANLPLNENGMTDSDYLAIFHNVLLPMAYEFQPQLVLFSIGFDAAIGCPKGEMKVSPACFGHLVSSMMPVANGRVGILLEGGYFVESVAEGVSMALRALLGDVCIPLNDYVPLKPSLVDSILNLLTALKPYWNNLNLQEYYQKMNSKEESSINHVPNMTFYIPKLSQLTSQDHDVDDDYIGHTPEKLKEFMEIMSQIRQSYKIFLDNVKNDDIALVYDPLMERHCNMEEPDHPERPERIQCIYNMLKDHGLVDRLKKLEGVRRANKEEICLVHDEEHWLNISKLNDITEQTEREIFADSYDSIFFNQDTFDSSLIASGELLKVVDSVITQETAKGGIAIIRPPGHHAEIDGPMGFCVMNNVGIAASYARKVHDVKRVLILDWDVHHGNGTQDMFYNDPSVLYISIHRFDGATFFPGREDADYNFIGEGKGTGFNVNIPWDGAGQGDVEYSAAFFNIVLPIAYEFNPELVLVSAGFDACTGDPLGFCKVTPQMYGHMTHHLSNLAGGKIIIALEGGYNLNSISLSMSMCTKALLGHPLPMPNTSKKNLIKPKAIESIRNVIRAHRDYWSSLRFFDKKLPTVLPPTKDIKPEDVKITSQVIEKNEEIIKQMKDLSVLQSKNDDYIPNQYGSYEKTSFINTLSSSIRMPTACMSTSKPKEDK